MSTVKEIFAAYVSLRKEGANPQDAIDYLKPRLAQLDNPTLETQFMKQVRQFEDAVLQRVQRQKSFDDDHSFDAPANQSSGDSFGQTTILTSKNTGRLELPSSSAQERTHIFEPDMMLVLRLPEYNHTFQVRPQDFDRNLIAGRSDARVNFVADIDLTNYGASQSGVSRQHMGIVYNARREQVIVRDLGSKNGLYINGRRMRENEVAVLYNTDQLELGRLIVWVNFERMSK